MEKLTKDDIQFIDNYLTNADVKHIDIRLEMIDHVATAIETEMQNGDKRGFYYIFKDYMLENKRKLLDDHRKFLRGILNRISLELFKNLFKPICVLVMIVVFLLLKYLNTILDFDTVKSWASGIQLTIFLIFIITYLIGISVSKLERISSVERLTFFFIMLFQIFHIGYNMSNFIESEIFQIVMFVLLSLIMAIFVSMLMITFRIISESKKKYSTLI